jgi:hypothetical protein
VETFWSCVTFAVTTHCGWHEPVRPGPDANGNNLPAGGQLLGESGAERVGSRVEIVAFVAGILQLGLLL